MHFYNRPNTSTISWKMFSAMGIDTTLRRRFLELRSCFIIRSVILALTSGIALGSRLRSRVVPGHMILVLKSCVA